MPTAQEYREQLEESIARLETIGRWVVELKEELARLPMQRLTRLSTSPDDPWSPSWDEHSRLPLPMMTFKGCHPMLFKETIDALGDIGMWTIKASRDLSANLPLDQIITQDFVDGLADDGPSGPSINAPH